MGIRPLPTDIGPVEALASAKRQPVQAGWRCPAAFGLDSGRVGSGPKSVRR